MIEEIAGNQQDRIDQALAKENAKLAWQADREAVKAKRKQAREEKKKEEKAQIRQEILNKKAPTPKPKPVAEPALPSPALPDMTAPSTTKKKKKSRSDSLPEPLHVSSELRSILKKPNTPNKKMRVTFSPTVHVKAIPRVKRSAKIPPTLYEMLALQSPAIGQRKSGKMKSRTKRRKYGRRGV